MNITHQHHFAAPLDEVMAMLTNEEFARRRAQASGADQADALVDGDASGEVTISIRRVVPASTIPAEFRSLVGTHLDVKYTEAWEAPGQAERVGTFALDISGTPGRVTGALELKPDGEGTAFFATGRATAPVPLFGQMIEKVVADAVVRAFTAELEAADAWLAGQR
ncbi:MAG: DUF2505 domain-containing protein [Actinobacteria bacterium HGW-Actinobacteria-4]|nr:MAG: DUF2505 domain-containing protein [Actinobacteria bacterium HGW-Actinobacteria-4]